jgi:hypothetical protein
MKRKWKTMPLHSGIAFGIQSGATISVYALYLIFAPILFEFPVIERFVAGLLAFISLLYVLPMLLLRWLHFPSGDGLVIYCGAWLLGTTVYSVIWGAIAVRLFGRR